MLPSHRALINESMTELIRVRNLNSIISEIERRKISFPEMVERIKVEAQDDSETLARLFFEHVQRRGPHAFRVLVQTLHLTGNAKQAYILDPECLCISQEELAGKRSLSVTSGLNSHSSSTSSLSLMSPKPTNGTHSLFDIDKQVSDNEEDESKRPIKIVVKKAHTYNAGQLKGCYQMFSKPRGYALVINNVQFEGDPEKLRLGAEHDSDNLVALLEEFGYQVTSLLNVNKQKLLDRKDGILKQFTDQFYEKDVDSCFVAIMSHGDDHFYIDMTDRRRPFPQHNYHRVHLWDDIIPFFNNENFGIFYGKPKIFLIQACRGHKSNVGIPMVSDANVRPHVFFDTSTKEAEYAKTHQVPQINHTFIFQSTIPGYKAMRDKYRGSWFIECVCDVFMNHAWALSLDDLYKKVALQLEQLITLDGNMQCCDFQQIGFGLKLYFNPGLFAQGSDESSIQEELEEKVKEDQLDEDQIEGAAALASNLSLN